MEGCYGERDVACLVGYLDLFAALGYKTKSAVRSGKDRL
jgi:hypothetical protein